jgi:MGT family glycosyltransferase
MRHVGIAVPPVSGHLNPALTLGKELVARGHRVTVFGYLDVREKVETLGFRFHGIAEDLFPSGSLADVVAGLGKRSGLGAMKYTEGWFRVSSRAWLRDLPEALRTEEIDLLLADQTEPGAFTAGEVAGVRVVVLCNALALHPEKGVPPFFTTWSMPANPWQQFRSDATYKITGWFARRFHAEVNEARRQHGLVPLPTHISVLPQFRYLSQQPDWFDFPRTMPGNFHYTGPWHRPESRHAIPFPWERLDGRPIVYASLGTLQNGVERAFRAIAHACAGEPVQLVMSLGRRDAVVPPDYPGDPVIVPFAPQVELLRRAAYVVTHAGLNTALETMSVGVPMVALPVTNDQPGVAARLRHLGVAEVLPFRDLDAVRLRAALRRIRAEPAYRERAIGLAERLHGTDWVAKAVDLALAS